MNQIQIIIEIASQVTCYSVEELLSRRRPRPLVEARHAAYRAAKHLLPMVPSSHLARAFQRDHSTFARIQDYPPSHRARMFERKIVERAEKLICSKSGVIPYGKPALGDIVVGGRDIVRLIFREIQARGGGLRRVESVADVPLNYLSQYMERNKDWHTRPDPPMTLGRVVSILNTLGYDLKAIPRV